MNIDLTMDELLAQRRWLERLAYQLVRDFDEAEDVTQEAYLAALKSRPQLESSRGWLGRVATNAARMRYRSSSRRRSREEVVHQPEEAPSSFELAHRKQCATSLARALGRLAEPYRSAVQLRFFSELSIAEVAAKQKVPVGTAGWRISEGLTRLRRDLEEDLGKDVREHLLLFVPATFSIDKPAAPAALSNGGLDVKIIAMLVVTAVLTAATLVKLRANGEKPRTALSSEVTPSRAIAAGTATLQQRKQHPAQPRPAAPLWGVAAGKDTQAALASQVNDPRKDYEIFFRVNGGTTPEERTRELTEAMGDDLAELGDLFIGCYSDLFARRPELQKRSSAMLDLTVTQDSELGPVVASSEWQDGYGRVDDDQFRECVRQTTFGFELPRDLAVPQGSLALEFGVSYEPERDLAKEAAIEDCFHELQSRRPELELVGHIDDTDFARCMDAATGANQIASAEQAEAMNECVRDVERRYPGMTPVELNQRLQSDDTFLDCMAATGATF